MTAPPPAITQDPHRAARGHGLRVLPSQKAPRDRVAAFVIHGQMRGVGQGRLGVLPGEAWARCRARAPRSEGCT